MKTSPIEPSIVAAIEELSEKSLRDVQRETAYKWAGRACAAQHLELGDDVHEYAHEALEHAALCPDEKVFREVKRLFKEWGIEP